MIKTENEIIFVYIHFVFDEFLEISIAELYYLLIQLYPLITKYENDI